MIPIANKASCVYDEKQLNNRSEFMDGLLVNTFLAGLLVWLFMVGILP